MSLLTSLPFPLVLLATILQYHHAHAKASVNGNVISGSLNNACEVMLTKTIDYKCACRPSLGGKPPFPPKIAAQGLTPPPTQEEDLAALVFNGDTPRCHSTHPITWTSTSYGDGAGVRSYYEHVGNRTSIVECRKDCQERAECFAAILTPKGGCYLLTTSHREVCNYHAKGHFGPILERCSAKQPCPVVYKTCGKPKCSLRSIVQTYCKTRDKLRAVTKCSSNSKE